MAWIRMHMHVHPEPSNEGHTTLLTTVESERPINNTFDSHDTVL